MKLKSPITVLFCLNILIFSAFSQSPTAPNFGSMMQVSGASLQDINSQMNTFLSSNPDGEEDGINARYHRWNDFWRKRVGNTSDPLGQGNFRRADLEMMNYRDYGFSSSTSAVGLNPA